MHPFDVAQGFLDACEPEGSPERLHGAFGEAIRSLGFRHFACCSHGDPLRPAASGVVALDYPETWVSLYSEARFDRIDPVFRRAGMVARPFFWDDADFLAGLDDVQTVFMAEAAGAGISDGYTIPLHAPAALPASCSLLPDSRSIDPTSYHAAHLMASYLHEALLRHARPPPNALSRRERQCLELAAQGKSDWVIGQILGISERTARAYIERAMTRFRVASRIQAIVQALFSHSISFGDVLKADNAPPPKTNGERPDREA